MTKTEIKARRYRKAKNIIHNNIPKKDRYKYDASRKHGLVKIYDTKKSKK